MTQSNARLRRIVLVGYPGAQSLDIVGPLEVFSMANRRVDRPAYEICMACEAGGAITCNSGLALAGAVAIANLPPKLDTILIAGGSDDAVYAAGKSALVPWIKRRASETRRVGSVCSGAFVLAAAGLLDNRRATTHWGFVDELRAFRPAIRLEPDAIFVADPPFYTSAGVTAGIDLALSLVESDLGPECALSVARNLVLFMRRAGGQSQFSPALNVQVTATRRLRKLIVDVASDPRGALGVPQLATRAGMSERNFARVFRDETGQTPAQFVTAARLDRAKSLLESSDWTLARVAERAGFGSPHNLHRAFQARLGVTPAEYRERFGSA